MSPPHDARVETTPADWVIADSFAAAFEHAPIGVGVLGPDGRFQKVNRSLLELVGYTEPELLTRRLQDITHPDDLERSLNSVRRMVGGETNAYHTEKRYIHHDGHVVTALLNASIIRDQVGRPLHLIVQMQDITERRRAEEELRESHERFHLLADHITDAFWIRSPDMQVVQYVSPAFERIWGRPVAELYAHPEEWLDFIVPEDRARVKDAFSTLTK